MSLQVGSVRLIDSFTFLPMALSAMPKAFDEPKMKKCYFPHLFNTEENQSYKGKWPDASFYSPASIGGTFYGGTRSTPGTIMKRAKCSIFKSTLWRTARATSTFCVVVALNSRTCLSTRRTLTHLQRTAQLPGAQPSVQDSLPKAWHNWHCTPCWI